MWPTHRPTPATDREMEQDRRKRLRRLAWLLDASVRLPGGFRVGLDSMLGLVPGIGDVAAGLIGSYIVYEARKMGAPRFLLLRMAANLAMETTIGSVPLVGDLFDFYYKANLRNVALLERFLEKTERRRPAGQEVKQ